MKISGLLRIYIAFLVPAIFGFAVALWARHYSNLAIVVRQDQIVVSAALFILSAISAGAAPLLYRIIFAFWNRHRSSVSSDELYRFERNLIVIIVATPYLALCAYVLQVPRLHFTGILLMTLYAVYYYYPGHNRIMADCKIYRVVPAVIADIPEPKALP
jgi:Ca2+/Na+ antiporter